jgi:hypothetical protein
MSSTPGPLDLRLGYRHVGGRAERFAAGRAESGRVVSADPFAIATNRSYTVTNQ